MEKVIEGILTRFPLNTRESLLPILQEIQQEAGHLSPDSLAMVSNHLNIPLNKIYGVATFYDEFHFQKRGEFHIKICQGTSCHLDRSSDLLAQLEKRLKIKAGQTRRDGKFSIELVSCLGACSKSPVISVNGTYHSLLTRDSLDKILSSL